ncbi:MAG: TerB family tellurite resistance protein, partial [Bacteroidota bacterium]|nr:TerB family tellurite resistance protein [Bacteroidota bacterium]
MARDYTKYEVEGIEGVFGKGKLVLAVVQDYCSKNECTFDELKAVFPDEAQAGNTGVFGTLDEAKEIAKKRARHYVKDPIKLSDTKIAVSNQWGDNLPLFIETAKGLGYDISAAGKTSNDATDNKSNEQSEESSNEEFSDQSFNTVEGITMIFRSMLSLDGEFTDDEAVKLVELVTPYVEYVGEELESVVTNALKIYNSNTFEQNFELVTSFSAIISERYSREICLKICKDLATLAWADGELHENESKYWSHILKAMGVSADEVNAAIASENTEGDEAMAVEEDNKTTLADYGLSREFGHALDDLPDEKYNDKDITALAKKYNEDVEAALTYAKSAYGWMWS